MINQNKEETYIKAFRRSKPGLNKLYYLLILLVLIIVILIFINRSSEQGTAQPEDLIQQPIKVETPPEDDRLSFQEAINSRDISKCNLLSKEEFRSLCKDNLLSIIILEARESRNQELCNALEEPDLINACINNRVSAVE